MIVLSPSGKIREKGIYLLDFTETAETSYEHNFITDCQTYHKMRTDD